MTKNTLATEQIKSFASGGRPTRVLIVENDSPVREGLARALTLERFEVTTAANGWEVLQRQIDRSQTDALLLDLDVPDQYRWNAVRRLSAANPLLSVIGITGRPVHNTLADAADLTAVLEKPFFEVPALLRLLGEAQLAGA